MGNANGGAPPPGGYGAPPGGNDSGFGPPGGGYGPPHGSSGYGPPPPIAPGTPLPTGSYGAPPGGYTPPPPPAGGFGTPAPYKMPPPSAYAIPAGGSFGLGLAIGLFGGCIGLALVHALAKGSDTKKGAAVGFAVFFALCAISQTIRVLAH